MSYFGMLYWLLIGHALADYAIQIPFKSPNRSQDTYPDSVYGPWWWGMLAHTAINGAYVYLLTGSGFCATVETVLHFLLDYAKCVGKINAVEDQAGHILSKILYAGFYALHV